MEWQETVRITYHAQQTAAANRMMCALIPPLIQFAATGFSAMEQKYAMPALDAFLPNLSLVMMQIHAQQTAAMKMLMHAIL